MKSRPLDPPEPWEAPFSLKDGGFFYEYRYAGHPFPPRSCSDLPEGAFAALGEACGLSSPGAFFVIPASVRFIGHRGRKVITPLQVLGIGPRGVGLWVEASKPCLAVAIGVDDLSAMEDVEILLYGRLSFLSASARLTIRYNTVARRLLEPALVRLRKSLSPSEQQVPRGDMSAADLPYKWGVILESPFLTIAESRQRAYRYQCRPSGRRRLAGKGQLLLLTGLELVFVRDSEDPMNLYGIDRFIFPRSRIESVGAGERVLDIVCGGTAVSLPMEQELVKAALGWLS